METVAVTGILLTGAITLGLLLIMRQISIFQGDVKALFSKIDDLREQITDWKMKIKDLEIAMRSGELCPLDRRGKNEQSSC